MMRAKLGIAKSQIAATMIACCFAPAILLAQTADPQIDTSQLLVPNSAEVIYDIQSTGITSKQQRGYVGDWQYVLYPDGSAEVESSADGARESYTLKCERGIACSISQMDGEVQSVKATGAPKPQLPDDVNGLSLARFVAEAVLAESGTPPEAPIPFASEDVVVEDEPETIVSEEVVAQTDEDSPEPEVVSQAAQTTLPEIERKAVAKTPIKIAQKTQMRSSYVRNRRPLKVVKSSKIKPANAQKAEPVFVALPKEKPKLKFGEKYKLACSVSATASLTYVPAGDDEVRSGKPRMSFGCYAQLSKRLSGRVALVRYFDQSQQAPWDPDFTYDFSYKVNDKIKLGYSNYSARFQGDGESFGKSLANGLLRGSYKLPKIKLPFDKTANCSASIRLPNPKLSSARLYCGVAVTKKLSIAATAHAYFPGTQESYQPDFTYTASYKISDLWNITYSNYGNNRFPWNKSTSPGRGLLGGSITVSYKIKF